MATLKNTTINDTGHITLPAGTTAQRPASPTVGMVRYNTSLGFAEQYNSDGWQGIAPPPVITSISPTSFNGESGSTITINGANFDTTATVQFILTGGTTVNATTTTRVSSGQLTATTPRDFLASESPATVKVNNGSGLTASAENALTFADVPVFSTAAGSLGTIYDSARGGYSLSTAAATDAAGGSIASYAITSGAVPTGLSFNTSTAAITGTASAVGSDTTSTFTVRATDNAGNTASRSFSITVRAPVITSYTSTGSTTFSVPTGLNSVEVFILAGGGGGGAGSGGHGSGAGAGAGGAVYVSSFPVSPGGSIPLNVGGGGSGRSGVPSIGGNGYGLNGGNSTFSTLTAIGGGGGGGGSVSGQPGGSGGGGGPANSDPNRPGGSATQPGQNPGVSNLTNYGTAGATTNPGAPPTGSGGGGATTAGDSASSSRGGNGGSGVTVSISGSSITYGGGGGGGQHGPSTAAIGTGGSGGGGNGGSAPNDNAAAGTTNRGGGGGGGSENPNGAASGAPGGSGIVIVKY
jgi:hypothetical protein